MELLCELCWPKYSSQLGYQAIWKEATGKQRKLRNNTQKALPLKFYTNITWLLFDMLVSNMSKTTCFLRVIFICYTPLFWTRLVFSSYIIFTTSKNQNWYFIQSILYKHSRFGSYILDICQFNEKLSVLISYYCCAWRGYMSRYDCSNVRHVLCMSRLLFPQILCEQLTVVL